MISYLTSIGYIIWKKEKAVDDDLRKGKKKKEERKR